MKVAIVLEEDLRDGQRDPFGSRHLEARYRSPNAKRAQHLSIDIEDHASAKILKYFDDPAGGFDAVAVVRLEDGPAACYGRGPVYLVGIRDQKLSSLKIDICNANPLVVSRVGGDIHIKGARWRNLRIDETLPGDDIVVHERKARSR